MINARLRGMLAFDVPLHIQDKDSEDCGPVSTAMILDYFGATSDQAEVIERVPRLYEGTSAFDNGLAMLEYGLDVEAITANPLVFDGDFRQLEPDDAAIRQQIETTRKNEKEEKHAVILDGLLSFLDKGGKLTIEIPTAQHIINAIDAGKLVFASTYTKVLGKNEGSYHFVVIGGYDKNQFLIFNPWPTSRHKSWSKIDDVMFAIHTNTLYDYDNGAILLAGKH